MSEHEVRSTRVIRGFTVQASTEQMNGPPGRFDPKITVLSAGGSIVDAKIYPTGQDPFQDETTAFEAALHYLQRIDVTEHGKLIDP